MGIIKTELTLVNPYDLHDSLLGAIPLQDLDVVINMQKECIEVNPESPDIQSCLLL